MCIYFSRQIRVCSLLEFVIRSGSCRILCSHLSLSSPLSDLLIRLSLMSSTRASLKSLLIYNSPLSARSLRIGYRDRILALTTNPSTPIFLSTPSIQGLSEFIAISRLYLNVICDVYTALSSNSLNQTLIIWHSYKLRILVGQQMVNIYRNF